MGQLKKPGLKRARTGCVTCKTRRVKCDEGKPACSRCIRFEVECEGYSNKVGNKKREKNVPVATYHRPLRSLYLSQSTISTITDELHIEPAFLDQTEQRYFLIYRDEIAPELALRRTATIWTRIVLQECHRERFMLEAIVAVAALFARSKDPEDNPRISHLEYALQKYSSALRRMRLSLSDGEKSLRTVLVGCLLVFTFESYQGNTDLAMSQARGGCRLLQNWAQRIRNKGMHRYRSPISSPAPDIIEDEIIHTFAMLDLHVIISQRTSKIDNRDCGIYESSRVENMPVRFASVDEAEQYSILFIRSCTNFIHSVVRIRRGASPEHGSVGDSEVGNSFDYEMGLFHRTFPSRPVPPRLVISQSKYMAEIKRWQTALNPFLSSTDERSKIGAAVLKIYSRSSELTIYSLLAIEECAYDSRVEAFREIVSLAQYLCEGHRKTHPPVIGILPALYLTVRVCRDRRVRNDVLKLLEANSKTEGVFVGAQMARVGRWFMELEEQWRIGDGDDSEGIPEMKRVRLSSIKVNSKAKTARLECVRRVEGSESQEIETLSTIVPWGRNEGHKLA